jgi:hypothetical protein
MLFKLLCFTPMIFCTTVVVFLSKSQDIFVMWGCLPVLRMVWKGIQVVEIHS